jgi:hypothetical protein
MRKNSGSIESSKKKWAAGSWVGLLSPRTHGTQTRPLSSSSFDSSAASWIEKLGIGQDFFR